MSGQSPYRTEIEQILHTHTRTRYAKVFRGMGLGLTDDRMAEEAVLAGEPVESKRIAYLREIVRMTLDDEPADGKTQAKYQAGLYRELFNYPMSPELRQHVKTRLAKLQQIDPGISSEPPGSVHLGANDRRKPEQAQPPCKECGLVHAGECW